MARTINLLVVMLMCLEILGASATALPTASDCGLAIDPEESSSSIFGAFLFEKAEEESERTEEEKAHLSRVVLIDFSRIALSLCAYYTSDVNLATNTTRYDVRPPVHQLNCVFLL